MQPKVITTGCPSIDQLLNGGIEIGTITQIYGESSSGKTNFCLQVSIEYIKNNYNRGEYIFKKFIDYIKNDENIDFIKKIKNGLLNLNINVMEIKCNLKVKKIDPKIKLLK